MAIYFFRSPISLYYKKGSLLLFSLSYVIYFFILYISNENSLWSSCCFLFVEVSFPYEYRNLLLCSFSSIYNTYTILAQWKSHFLPVIEGKKKCINKTLGFFPSLCYFFSNFVNECRVMDIGLILWLWALSMFYVLVHLITPEKNLHHLRKWRRYLIIQLPFVPSPFVQWIS